MVKEKVGNICKGPVGVGYTCYCAPFFKNLKIRMERDKREFQRAQVKLDQRVSNLEHLIQRNLQRTKKRKCSFTRCRSLEMLDTFDKPSMHTARSMDDVDHSNETELFEDKLQPTIVHENNNSESSDEEHPSQKRESKWNDAILTLSSVSNCDVLSTNALPRYRGGVYSPSVSNTLDTNLMYVENMIKVKDTKQVYNKFSNNPDISTYEYRFQPEMKYAEYPYLHNYGSESNSNKYYEQSLTSKLAKLRVLDNFKNDVGKVDAKGITEDTNFVTTHLQDSVDRDTNNDSGYSTKVYGSSKGNSPNLSGQIDSECLGASSLV
ncbi:uncharacterized protein LOC108911301 [Anoplophora glabripennis]|uniref:uncharacterized protein LOC108911301 n=1 Tax=Anoplophora glabripennis TaxID=217634 RepID=UPI00087530DD|nr:uncharacterized protein LOC108911301 [Anoplophora glabripennis]